MQLGILDRPEGLDDVGLGDGHGRRFLVNDHAPSNPYPSAVAISVERNSAQLADYMKDWM